MTMSPTDNQKNYQTSAQGIGSLILDCREITFCICGRLSEEYLQRCIGSIRKFFPGASIIISTWSDKATREIAQKFHEKVDTIVYCDDPGSPLRNPVKGLLHNVNRMIVTGKEGLVAVKTPYVMKLRADLEFTSRNLLNTYGAYSNGLEAQVLVSNQTSIDARRGNKMMYHLCDWYYFGPTKVISEIFNVAHMPDEYCDWYARHKKPEDSIDKGNQSRFMAEDWVISQYLGGKSKVEHQFYLDYSDAELLVWEKHIHDEFIVLPNEVVGVVNQKFPKIRDFHRWQMLSLTRFKELKGIEVSIYESTLDRLTYFKFRMLFSIWKIRNSFWGLMS